MKHYINEIDNRTADSEDTIIISEPWKSIDLDVPIKIEKFPAEFKKNIYKTIDIRFLLILLFSVVLNAGTILMLEKFIPAEMTNKTISRIQERYAKILESIHIKS